MSRPLVISDCDEVLLHMVVPFRDWLDEAHGVEFRLENENFAGALRWKDGGEVLGPEDVWRLLGAFFDTEMHRQGPIEGAVAAANRLAEQADLVVLTNLRDARLEHRTRQLAEHGINARVFTNQGPKGPALKAIVEEYQPSRAIFIDDLPQHHRSAREHLTNLVTLHFCGEPLLAPHIDCAHRSGHADARIDSWGRALPWLLEQLQQENA